MVKNFSVNITIANIDAKFADIQRYINGLDFLDDWTKGNLIICCMECNDEITRQIQEEKIKWN